MIVLTTSAVALAPMLQFRPQLFDFIALSALLMLLARDSYRDARGLWIAVPIFALWANLHGGFFIGIAALAMYTLVIAIEELVAGEGLAHTMHLGGVTAACVLATLLNPDGIGNWFTVMHTMRQSAHPLDRQRMAAVAVQDRRGVAQVAENRDQLRSGDRAVRRTGALFRDQSRAGATSQWSRSRP